LIHSIGLYPLKDPRRSHTRTAFRDKIHSATLWRAIDSCEGLPPRRDRNLTPSNAPSIHTRIPKPIEVRTTILWHLLTKNLAYRAPKTLLGTVILFRSSSQKKIMKAYVAMFWKITTIPRQKLSGLQRFCPSLPLIEPLVARF